MTHFWGGRARTPRPPGSAPGMVWYCITNCKACMVHHAWRGIIRHDLIGIRLHGIQTCARLARHDTSYKMTFHAMPQEPCLGHHDMTCMLDIVLHDLYMYDLYMSCQFIVYWGLTPQQQPGSYQGGEMMMMKSVFWWRKPCHVKYRHMAWVTHGPPYDDDEIAVLWWRKPCHVKLIGIDMPPLPPLSSGLMVCLTL